MYPDVTVCNLNPLWHNAPDWGLQASLHGTNKSQTYDQYIMTVVRDIFIKHRHNDTFKILMSMHSIQGFMKHVILNDTVISMLKDTIIWRCKWHTIDHPNGVPCEHILPIITPDLGLCFTVKPPRSVHNNTDFVLKGMTMIIFLNSVNNRYVFDFGVSPFESFSSGARVILHPGNTAPNLQEGFTVSPGTEASIVATQNIQTRLDKYNSNCSTSNSLDIFTDPDDNPGDRFIYTKWACESFCMQKHIIDECGCIYPDFLSHEFLRHRHPYCSLYNITDPDRTIRAERCPSEVRSRLEKNRKCNMLCKRSCREMYYTSNIAQVWQ